MIGCCVMGGIFSEGIDLKEECLIGAVVVGTGIPMVCHERELFKDYYEEKKGDGFSYAYLYPAVNKVFYMVVPIFLPCHLMEVLP